MKLGKILFIGFLTIFISVLLYGYYFTVSSPYMISAEKARSLINQKKIDFILDVRTKTERDVFGYFPGSIHIPAGSLDQEVIRKYPNKDVNILIYCNTGQRARLATEKLKSFGFKNVFYIPTSHVSLF
jgi:rhodanese-related sulfurtransferase